MQITYLEVLVQKPLFHSNNASVILIKKDLMALRDKMHLEVEKQKGKD